MATSTKPNTKVKASIRRRAERIIANETYPANFRAKVQDALDNRPEDLPRLFAKVERVQRQIEEFGQGLHAFGTTAYLAALGFYAANYNNPDALDRYSRTLAQVGGRKGRTR